MTTSMVMSTQVSCCCYTSIQAGDATGVQERISNLGVNESLGNL